MVYNACLTRRELIQLACLVTDFDSAIQLKFVRMLMKTPSKPVYYVLQIGVDISIKRIGNIPYIYDNGSLEPIDHISNSPPTVDDVFKRGIQMHDALMVESTRSMLHRRLMLVDRLLTRLEYIL